MSIIFAFPYLDRERRALALPKKVRNCALNNRKRCEIPLFCSTFAAVKRKSAIFLMLSALILMGACTPLSLLNKGKKAVKAVEAYVESEDGLTRDIGRVVAAVTGSEVPADSVVAAADSTAAVADSALAAVGALVADSMGVAADSLHGVADSLAGVADSMAAAALTETTLSEAETAAARLKRDTTMMDSLELLIYKRNKAIDDSLAFDSLNRQKKNGIDAPVKYSANDSLIYEAGTGTAWLYGDSHVEYQNMDLKSEHIYMNLDSSIVHATPGQDSTGVKFGTPIFKMGSDEYQNDTMAFNFKTKKGIISQVYTQQEDGYLTAELAKRGETGEIFLQHGRYTTCDEPHPDFYLAISRGKLRAGKDVVFGPAYLVVCDVPLPLAIPYGFFPFTKSYSSGFIMPTYGDETERGFYLRDGGYYFAISDKMDLKLIGEIYTKGSWGVSAASNYRKRYKFSGSFYASYQNTVNGEKNMPDYMQQTSFKIQWSHRQDAKANPFSSLSASVNFATSSYERNNLTSMYNPQSMTQSTRTSSVSWNTSFSSIGLSLSSTVNLSQNMRDSTIAMTLPDLNVSLSRFYPFKRKKMVGKERWYEKISMSYTGHFSNSVNARESEIMKKNIMKDWNNNMTHSIPVTGNFTLFDYINVSPSFNFNDVTSFKKMQKSWDDTAQKEVTDTLTGLYNVYRWNMSVGMSTTLYGMYTPSRKIFGDKIEAVRHVLTPSVSFSYAPDFGASRYGYYQTYQRTDAEGNVSLVEYSPYQISGVSVPGKGKTGSVSFDLKNNVEMKLKDKNDSVKKVSIIDALDLSMSYNMAAKVRPLSNLNANIRLKLTKRYTFNLNAIFASYVYEADSVGATPRESEHTTYWQQGQLGRFQGMSQNLSYTLDNNKIVSLIKWLRGERDDKKGKNRQNSGDDYDDDEYDNEVETNIDRDLEAGKHGARREGAGKAETDEDGYMAFSLPWSLSIGYGITMRENTDRTKFNYKTMRYPYKLTQNLNVSGNIRISDGWNISFSSGYDFENKKVSMTTASLSRDLHCFNMSCSVVLAPYTSYNFTFRCNASTLTDALKYDKRSSYSNAVQWY